MEPYHSHTAAEPIEPGKIYRFDIRIEPMAHRFKKGNRIRLEIVNGDSVVTDVLWTHYYVPSKIGTDTIYHSAAVSVGAHLAGDGRGMRLYGAATRTGRRMGPASGRTVGPKCRGWRARRAPVRLTARWKSQ